MWGVVGEPGAVSPVTAANTRLAVFLLCLSLAAAARRTPRPTPYPAPPTTTSTFHVGFRQLIVLAFSEIFLLVVFYLHLNPLLQKFKFSTVQ
jgi:hypothetical protein